DVRDGAVPHLVRRPAAHRRVQGAARPGRRPRAVDRSRVAHRGRRHAGGPGAVTVGAEVPPPASAVSYPRRDEETWRSSSAAPPLYTARDAVRVQELMIGVPYDEPCDVLPGVRATFVDAGHILGSASVLLDVTEGGATKRLVFSGDVGRSGLAIIRDPVPPEG